MQHRMVFFVVAVAVILAIAGFLLLSFLTRGDTTVDTPADQPVVEQPLDDFPTGVPVQVDGTTVLLQTVPERAVSLSQPPPEVLPTVPEVQPTPQPTNTPVFVEVPVLEPTAPPPPAAGGNDVIFVDYVVQPGDTLYSIADEQATSIELMAVHGISAEDLAPGTTLRLPVANPAVCPGTTAYVVRPGDTVFSLSRTYNTTTQAIASANALGPNFRIDVAQVLCIP